MSGKALPALSLTRPGLAWAPPYRVEITDALRPGVVSIPHGWGHGLPGTRGAVAAAHAGVNSNLLADDRLLDEPSGTAVLNGIPVEVSAAG